MSTVKFKGSTSGEAEVTVAAAAGTPTITLPTASINLATDGSNGQYLKTDGAGTLSFATVASPGGATGTDYNDSVKVRFGTDNDLEIWHTGSQGHIKNTTGDLRICGDTVFLRGEGDSEDYIKCWKDGAVKLFYNDVEKLATTATGVQVNGNLIIGSAGNGIDFSDTGDTGGMTNELLDDYEEGTWTPDFEELTVDAGNSYASYVKIGNLCQITCRIQCDGAGSSSSAVKITGLPFSRVSYHEIYFSPMLGKVDTDEGGYGPVCHGYSYGADKLIFERNNRLETGSNAYLTADICGDNATFQFTYVYRTA